MERKTEKVVCSESFLHLNEAEEKINKWIEEDYNKKQIQTTFLKYKSFEKFEKTCYESLIKKLP